MIYYDEDGNAKIINKGRKFYQVHDGDMEYIKSIAKDLYNQKLVRYIVEYID